VGGAKGYARNKRRGKEAKVPNFQKMELAENLSLAERRPSTSAFKVTTSNVEKGKMLRRKKGARTIVGPLSRKSKRRGKFSTKDRWKKKKGTARNRTRKVFEEGVSHVRKGRPA